MQKPNVLIYPSLQPNNIDCADTPKYLVHLLMISLSMIKYVRESVNKVISNVFDRQIDSHVLTGFLLKSLPEDKLNYFLTSVLHLAFNNVQPKLLCN